MDVFLTTFVVFLLLLGDSNAIENKPTNATTTSRCTVTQFRCEDGSCIPASRRCDGSKDCPFHEDEKDCPVDVCEPGYFRCKEDGHCISEFWVCDGHFDCFSDHSDEANCTKTETTSTDTICPEGQFHCGRGDICVLNEWLCDGEVDCQDGSDESKENCQQKTQKKCRDDEFECEPGSCIPHRWVCDGGVECANGKDEGDHCGEYRADCALTKGYFPCSNTTESRCLEAKYVCDKTPQCPDKEDEGTFCDTADCAKFNCSHGCMETKNGPVCFCPEGLKLEEGNNKSCVDVNECEVYGVCSQLCVDRTPGYSCSCYPGFTLVNNTCKATGADVMIYFSTETSIRSYNVRTNVYRSVANNLNHVIGVAYDGVEDRVYWTDVSMKNEQVESIRTSGIDRKLLLKRGLEIPEDIVVDEASRVFYFSDSVKGHIVACKLDASVCTVIEEDNEHPRGLAIHNRDKLLFYSDWGSKPRIVRIGLDGSNRVDLVTEGLHWPNGVAVDQVLDRVYWSDAKLDILESAYIDGSDRRVILQEIHMLHPFSLALFEDTLYWSDWDGSMLMSCNKFTGKDKKVILKEGGLKIMGITVYHPLLHQNVVNPCKEHQCSHMCLPKPVGNSSNYEYSCVCPQEMTLGMDGRTCKANTTSALVVAVNQNLYKLNPHKLGNYHFQLIGELPGQVGSIAPDLATGNLFIASNSDTIVHYHVEKKQRRTVSSSHHISHVAYDYINKNIYWIDVVRRSIMVQSPASKATKALIENLRNPKALVFCGIRQELLFLDSSKLVSASADGTHMSVLSDNIPNTVRLLYYNEQNDTLLLADSTERLVHQFDLDSRDLSIFMSGLHSILSMAVLDGYFYWTQHSGHELFWVKFAKGAHIERANWMPLTEVSSSPLDLVLLSVTSNNSLAFKDIAAPCTRAFCQQFCFSSSGLAQCSCEFGHNLLADNRTCQAGCPSSTFACNDTSNHCIHKNWECDGTADCLNGSDEANCTALTICDPDKKFRCDDGLCIQKSWRCDLDSDCLDGSDEKNCPLLTCDLSIGHFMCEDKKKCILEQWKCDNTNDCEDGSDEKNCTSLKCAEELFACKDGTECLPARWICDGSKDCRDGSDEGNCTVVQEESCAVRNMYHCQNGNCIDTDLVCDKEDDCGDGSDEVAGFCLQTVDQGLQSNCDDGFKCGFQCLPLSARCNGVTDCDDESDEENCAVCTPDTWRCQDGKSCIPKSWKCDGARDCNDGSDEDECIKPKTGKVCTDQEYRCKTGECIPLTQACDGYTDCEDGSDENRLKCKDVCSVRNGGCSHVCNPTPQGPVCSCANGLATYKEDGTLFCEDVDECKSLTSCPQYCANTKGSYKCTCAKGFISENNGKVCRALGSDPKMIYITESHIKAIDLVSRSHHLCANYSVYLKSFDLNQATGEIFASVPAKNMIALITVEDMMTCNSKSASNVAWLHNVDRPNLVAVDWVTRNVYYTQLDSEMVGVCSYSRNCTQLFRSPMAHITGIAVDPLAGRIFISAFRNTFISYPVGGVWTLGLDGQIVKGVYKLSSEKISIPIGLTIDVIKQTVYWMDKDRGLIMSNNYMGDNLVSVYKVQSISPAFLTNFQNKLYWVTPDSEKITSYDLISGTLYESPKSMHVTRSTHSIKIIQEQVQPAMKDPCESAGCSHICLLTADFKTSCACPSSFVPTPADKNKCQPDPRLYSTTTSSTTSTGSSGSGSSDQVVGDDDIKREPVYSSDSKAATIAGVVVVLVLLLGAALGIWWSRKRKGKQAEDTVGFTNSFYSLEDEGSSNSNSNQGQTLESLAHVMKRGTIVSCDNPLFVESPASATPSRFGSKFFKNRGQPRMDSINIDSPAILSVAKGASTPTMKRPEMNERDSAFTDEPSASIDYEDLTDQHLSVVFHQDKLRLIED